MGLKTQVARVDQSSRAPSKQAWREGEKWWPPAPESKKEEGEPKVEVGELGLLQWD